MICYILDYFHSDLMNKCQIMLVLKQYVPPSAQKVYDLSSKNRMFLKCSCGKIICCLGSAPKDNIGFQGVGLKLVAKESKNVNILYL